MGDDISELLPREDELRSQKRAASRPSFMYVFFANASACLLAFISSDRRADTGRYEFRMRYAASAMQRVANAH